MTERVYLHVGAPKSGTTYLQQVLESNRARLADAGVLVVGETHLDRIHAAMVVRQDPRLEGLPERASAAWSRLVQEIRQWPGAVAVLSYELFAGASEEQVAAALADLDGLEVHVVVTARDLAASVPSAWQERLKFALTTPLEQWRPRPASAGPRAEWGWRTLDPAGVAARWGAGLPPERVHVVTVPREGAGPDALWHRFAEATGLAVDGLDLHPERSNESLGVVPAELLRRVNERLGDRLAGSREQAVWLRDTLAHQVLVPLGRERIGLTESQFADAERRAQDAITALREAGYAVHGDLEDLLAVRTERRTPGQAGDAELLDVAVSAVADLLLLLRERTHAAGSGGAPDPAEAEDEHEAGGIAGLGRRLVKNTAALALRRDADRLHARVETLEARLQDQRRLQLRVAELSDLVTELLLPAAERDEDLTAETLRAYRKESL